MDDPDLLKNRKEKKVCTPFGEPSDVLITGDIGGVSCVLLARHGRRHNVMPGKVNYRANVWALKQENCTHIVATTATGSLREHIKPGDLVVLDSFIDRWVTFYIFSYIWYPSNMVNASHLLISFCICTKKYIV